MALAVLSIDLEARLAKLEQGMDRAGRIAERSANQMADRFKKLDAIGAGLVRTFTAAFSVGMISAFVSRTIDGIDALNDMADATGTTVENASALEDIAARTGTKFETVTSSLIKMNQALNAATKGSEAERALKQIGLDAAELRKLDPSEALLRIAKALSTFADDGNKGRLVLELFGKSTREVAPLLKDLAENGKLNATVTAEQAKQAERFNHQLSALSKNVTDAARGILGDLLPALNKMFAAMKSDGLGGIAAAISNQLDREVAATKIEQLTAKMRDMAPAVADARAVLERPIQGGFLEAFSRIRAESVVADFEKMTIAVAGYRDQLEGRGAQGRRPANEGGGGLRSRILPSVGIIPDKPAKTAADKPIKPFVFEIDPTTAAALKRLEETDSQKIAQLRLELQALIELRGDSGGGSVDEAILDVEEALAKLTPQGRAAAAEIERIQALLSNVPSVQLRSVVSDVELLNREFSAGRVSVEDWATAVRDVTARLPGEIQPHMENISEFAQEAGRNIQDALGDTIVATLDGKFSDIGRLWGNMIKRMVAEAAAAKIGKYLLGDDFAKSGNVGGALADVFKFFGSFSGGFATGGYIPPGKWGMTGEKGPEPIFGGRSGVTVLPNGSGSKQAGSTFQVIVQGDASENTIRLVNGAIAQFEARMMMRGA